MIRDLLRFGCAVVEAAAHVVGEALATDKSRALVAALTRAAPDFAEQMALLGDLFPDR